MKMTVSRASDDFIIERDVRRNYPPCKQAVWDEEREQWCIYVGSVKKMIRLNTRLIVQADGPDLPHLILDDISGAN